MFSHFPAIQSDADWGYWPRMEGGCWRLPPLNYWPGQWRIVDHANPLGQTLRIHWRNWENGGRRPDIWSGDLGPLPLSFRRIQALAAKLSCGWRRGFGWWASSARQKLAMSVAQGFVNGAWLKGGLVSRRVRQGRTLVTECKVLKKWKSIMTFLEFVKSDC